MKISNYETALKLSKITNKPLEDFYDGIIPSEDKQNDEEKVETEREIIGHSTSSNISETRGNQEEFSFRRSPSMVQKEEATPYTIKYGGRLSENGVVIGHTKDMTNVEYKILTKKMTQNELLKSPLLYVFFRAEDQKEANFYNWLEKFPKE